MKSVIFGLAVVVFVSNAWAQSAEEYVELLCATQETIASAYPGDPIEDILVLKTREINFWKSRAQDALTTKALVESGGPEAINTPEQIEAAAGAIQACTAYFKIEPAIDAYLQNNTCVDAKGSPFDVQAIGTACSQLIPR